MVLELLRRFFGFGTSFLGWVASFAAIYLLILARTNWRTNILTSLLVPYIFFSLPSILFKLLSGEVGKWIAFIAVVLRLFFPRHFPDWLEMPGSMILLLVVAPSFFAHTFRNSWVSVLICLVIGSYLLQEHIRASGGLGVPSHRATVSQTRLASSFCWSIPSGPWYSTSCSPFDLLQLWTLLVCNLNRRFICIIS